MQNYYNQIKIYQNILLLQGPVGPFFNHLAEFMISNNRNVHKIHFHYGEKFFYKYPSTMYKGNPANWLNFFSTFVVKNNIRQIFLIGSHKIYHKIAINYCNEHNIKVVVVEEGYIRNNFITIEENGVNGDSILVSNRNSINQTMKNKSYLIPQQTITLNTFANLYNKLSYFYKYSLGLFITQFLNPNYQHHIPYKGINTFFKWQNFYIKTILATIFPWQKELNTKWLYKNQTKYYIVILQIKTDSAITKYSGYDSIEDFIDEVIHSFAKHAPSDTKLLIKHHPYDRGIHCYKSFINTLTKKYSLGERIKYIIDAHLDLALELSAGCILVNSTTGYDAIARGIKTIALSNQAVFNLPELTYQYSLDNFWTAKFEPNIDFFNTFKSHIIYQTQMRGCFYGGSICDFNKKFYFD